MDYAQFKKEIEEIGFQKNKQKSESTLWESQTIYELKTKEIITKIIWKTGGYIKEIIVVEKEEKNTYICPYECLKFLN